MPLHRSVERTATTPWTADFHCRRCGNCCRIPGEVRLTEAATSRIATFLSLNDKDFIEQYTKLTLNRDGLSLIDGPGNSCIFLSSKGECRINPVKPEQCRDFPRRWNNPGFEKICRSMQT